MPEGSTDRPSLSLIRLFLVGSDPVFQLGLRIGLEQHSVFEVVDTEVDADSLWPTVARAGLPNIFVLDLDPRGRVDLALVMLCRELKQRYPALPIAVISGPLDPEIGMQLQQVGLEGYIAKGSSLDLISEVLQTLMQGERAGSAVLLSPGAVWGASGLLGSGDASDVTSGTQLSRLKATLRQNSVQHIRQRRQQLSQDLASERIAWWQWVVLSGQLREVKAAQFLVERLFSAETGPTEPPVVSQWPSVPALTTSQNKTPKSWHRSSPTGQLRPQSWIS